MKNKEPTITVEPPNDYCPHCSNPPYRYVIHAGKCPYVKAIEYYPDGSIKRVEFKEVR